MRPILEIRGIYKKYTIRHELQQYVTLRDSFTGLFRPSKTAREEFLALDDVSIMVNPGEALGVIGRNGAGKSTLLKVISKITPPSKGSIISRGRLASLLEVGTGFHPELTGRENIFFNGSILGMSRSEIKESFDAIVDFAGTEKFLDTALKQYSNGMQLRLAFAVAAFLRAEILVIDEVLAVGDAEFQKKCLGKMQDVSKSGRTILFVSHNMAAVENLCNKAILLNNGKLLAEGSVPDVSRRYRALFDNISANKVQSTADRKEDAYFKSIEVNLKGKQPEHKLDITCQIQSKNKHKDAFLAFDITNSIGISIMQAIPTSEPFIKYSGTYQVVRVEIDLPPLIPDVYRLSAWLGSHNSETLCWDRDVLSFEINDSPMTGRTFPHSHNNGFVIPHSRIVNG